MRGVAARLLAIAICAAALEAAAHPLAPSLLEIDARQPQSVRLSWRSPASLPAGDRMSARLVGCAASTERARTRAWLGDARTWEWSEDCSRDGLDRVRVELVAADSSARDVIVRIRSTAGSQSHLLNRDRPRIRLRAAAPRWRAFGEYIALGFAHIWAGADHLAFIAGLLVVTSGWRRRIATLSAFTLGHSATLAAAVLGAISVRPALAEFAIALSLFALALRMLPEASAARPRASMTRPGASEARRTASRAPRMAGSEPAAPLAFAFGFGLLHGLGFAGALADLGLRGSGAALALLGFNLGVEAGQIAFVAAALALTLAPLVRGLPRALPAYAVGSLAALWCLDRTLALFA